MSIIPIKGGFENPKAMLMHIAEDEGITGFVICVFRETGSVIPAHINLTHAEMAYAGACITAYALDTE